MTESRLAPQSRRRSLAELNARIVEAEGIQVRRRAAVQAMRAGSKEAVLAGLAMQHADERVALLRQSRDVLTGDGPSK